MKLSKAERKQGFSPRSQRTLLKQRELERELEKFDGLIHSSQESVADLKAANERHLRSGIVGGSREVAFRDRLREIEDTERQLRAYKEHLPVLQAEIEALAPSPSARAERLERQNRLAALATERLDVDRSIDAALENLRKILKARAELTSRMREAANAIELAIDYAFFDGGRFEELLNSLPAGMAAGSKAWVAWLLGEKGQNTKVYVVDRDGFTLPETLASAHVYSSGDRIELAEEQAAKLRASGAPIASLEPEVRKADEIGLARLKGEASRPLSIQEVADFVRR